MSTTCVQLIYTTTTSVNNSDQARSGVECCWMTAYKIYPDVCFKLFVLPYNLLAIAITLVKYTQLFLSSIHLHLLITVLPHWIVKRWQASSGREPSTVPATPPINCTVLYWRLWTQATASMSTSLYFFNHLNRLILTTLINSCQKVTEARLVSSRLRYLR